MPSAYGYCRRSVAREDQISLQGMRSQIEAYHAIKFSGAKPPVPLILIEDEGVSGAVPLFDRPSGRQLLGLLQRGDHLIIPKIDRAWRSLADGALMLGWLEETGIHLHALDLSVDSSTPAGRVCLHIMLALAEMERARIGERRRDANAERRRQGLPWFAADCAPFGWSIIGPPGHRQFVPNHPERRMLRGILRMHQGGLGYRRLEQRLRALGRLNRHGRPWTRSSLRRALWAAKQGFPVISHDAGKWGSPSDYQPQWHRRKRTAAGKWWRQQAAAQSTDAK